MSEPKKAKVVYNVGHKVQGRIVDPLDLERWEEIRQKLKTERVQLDPYRYDR